MNTALYLLRTVQLGLRISDLDNLEVGMILDMITESGNDNCEYDTVASQSDFDNF